MIHERCLRIITAQKKFSIKDFFIKCDQIRSFRRVWSHLLKKSSMGKFTFYAVYLFNDKQLSFNELLNIDTSV